MVMKRLTTSLPLVSCNKFLVLYALVTVAPVTSACPFSLSA